LVTDFYEYTMANGYYESGRADDILYFDMFFRTVPDDGGFAIACGLDLFIDYIQNLHFDDEDIAFLASKGIFSQGYLDSLKNFKFTGDIWAVSEGTAVFPGEPLVQVRARAVEAQIIETYLLLCLNHSSLIATKANRIVRAAKGRTIMEFGSRRAQGADGAYIGARAAYIAGAAATACTLSDLKFGVPATGTMAHSWIQTFDSEYEAFKTYCEIYPNNASLLIDTYDVMKSGLPNAIKVFKEVLLPKGITKCSVRIDSGDIAYLSKKCRQKLDEEGLTDCKIIASNSLDENIIRDIISQEGCVDSFGVGERLITAKSNPVFGGVYKLVAVEKNGEIIPKIKVSENVAKITTPGFKEVWRIYGETNKAEADLITLRGEEIDFDKPIELFDPIHTWKRKTFDDYTARQLLVPIFRNGELVYNRPDTEEIRAHCQREIDSLWDEVKRFDNPHEYYVDLSQKLWDTKNTLLHESRG
ncbi:MAG: nicotinate phosphoribosyltransferase, partial [Oscillospiraceae bacterium]|nr:nicotinate phosphoribosyltransferase [Oscillospiraceae bacterium]